MKTPILNIEDNLFIKLEMFNLGGSHKFRAAKEIINLAICQDLINESTRLIDKSGGNFAIGLAIAAQEFNLPVDIVIPRGYSPKRKTLLKSIGINLIGEDLVDAGILPRDIISNLLAQNKSYYYTDQFSNIGNYQSHYHGTATEYINQIQSHLENKHILLVAGAGTGASAAGHYRKFLDAGYTVDLCIPTPPKIDLNLSSTLENTHFLEGFLVGVFPPFLKGIPFRQIKVTEKELIASIREINERFGLQVGLTSAANYAAVKKLCDRDKKKTVVVTIFYDSIIWYQEKLSLLMNTVHV